MRLFFSSLERYLIISQRKNTNKILTFLFRAKRRSRFCGQSFPKCPPRVEELQLGRKGSFFHPFPFHPAWIPSRAVFILKSPHSRVRAVLTPLRAQAATLGLDPARAAPGAQPGAFKNLQLLKLGTKGAVEGLPENRDTMRTLCMSSCLLSHC